MSNLPDPSFCTKTARLRDRSEMLGRARAFFHEKGLLEVDCPILSRSASLDIHIDLIPALYAEREKVFLHSSPEFGMKRLLALGMGDIYQLSHVFRDGELGPRHNPEFMMAEWYRIGFSFEQMIQETVDFIHLFLNPLPLRIVSYRQIFLETTGIDYVTASKEELVGYLKQKEIPTYPTLPEEGKDALLNLILATEIEPSMEQMDSLIVLTHYPSSQAALARKRYIDDEEVAERFEIYYRGVELANGYNELTHAAEQRTRFMETNHERKRLGKEPLPLDENFLTALHSGMPSCCGVAVGFDRLMMLRQQQPLLSNVLAWSWDQA